jgi:hypothetical protein
VFEIHRPPTEAASAITGVTRCTNLLGHGFGFPAALRIVVGRPPENEEWRLASDVALQFPQANGRAFGLIRQHRQAKLGALGSPLFAINRIAVDNYR